MSSNNRLVMKEDPEKFHRSNSLSARDAIICLKEYAHKFTSAKMNVKIIDIGSGDGRVTEILKDYVPKNYEYLIGSDLSAKMVKFANDRYQNERTKFITLDIEGDLPDHLKGYFDYAFSSYTFNWVRQQQKAFTNVYRLLMEGGVFFAIFLAYSPIYTVFLTLSKSDKWRVYLENVNQIVSPYYKYQKRRHKGNYSSLISQSYNKDPDKGIDHLLKEIGFQNTDVKCRQMVFAYESVQKFKAFIAAVNPFDIPEELCEDFLNDFVDIGSTLGLIDETNNKVQMIYNLIVIYCVK